MIDSRDQESLQEEEQHQHDRRREVEAAGGGHQAADRCQDRLGQSEQETGDRVPPLRIDELGDETGQEDELQDLDEIAEDTDQRDGHRSLPLEGALRTRSGRARRVKN